MPDTSEILRFDAFELDPANRQLRRGGEPIELGSRYFDALALMVRDGGALVSKNRFMEEVWRGIPVTDEALTQCIRTLRRALGDDAASPRYIQTVPKHGYRFIAQPAGAEPANAPLRASGLAGAVAGWATLAGGAAGVMGGLFYGLLASTGGGSTVLVLAALVGALGVLAGAGVGLGMASALAWRGRADATLVLGAALGGMAVGALGGTLGKDGIGLLTGSRIGQVTGLFEGLILGLAVGAAAWLALARTAASDRRVAMPAALGAIALGALSGMIIHATDGRLLGGSLLALQRQLGGSQLALERIGLTGGRAGPGSVAQLLTALGEGSVFVLAVTLGLLAARTAREPKEKGGPVARPPLPGGSRSRREA